MIEHLNAATDRLTRWDYWISEPATTNNRMALRSAIEAFRVISSKGGRFRVRVHERLAIPREGYDGVGLRLGEPRMAPAEGAIENLALWQELVSAAAPHRVQWQWVRGHMGHPQNEYANDLAVRAAKEQTASAGARTSGFDEWLEAQRLRKRVIVEPAPFPTGQPFAPTRPLPWAGTSPH